MPTFLESMKEYVDSARARMTAAEQAHRAASAELAAASTDFAVWNNAYTLALKEKEKWHAEAKEVQADLPMELAAAQEPPEEQAAVHPAEINKTEKVREILAEHVSGITPGQLWVEVRDFHVSRPYLYSVLKRLRDNEEVYVRRGKYMLKPKPEDVKPTGLEEVTIQ